MDLETISLNLTPRGIRKRVQTNYGDVGPVLKMAVYQDDDAFPLTGMSAVLEGTKQGGMGFSVTCTVSGNVASAALTSAMTDDPGIVQAELEITDGQNTYHTENFEIVVEAPAHTKDTIDGDAEEVRSSLTKMLKELATGLTGPTVALRASAMTDHSKIYLYEGTESGYSAGYLYYYNGSAWKKGNQYASVTSAVKLAQVYNTIYPVGSVYISTSSTDPTTIFGGKWTRLKDRFLLAAGDTYSAGSTGGEATHTLTSAEMPSHAHNLSSDARAHAIYWGMSDATVHAAAKVSAGAGSTSDNNLGTIQSVWAHTATSGKGQAHNNMPPYIAVYIWQRAALASANVAQDIINSLGFTVEDGKLMAVYEQ